MDLSNLAFFLTPIRRLITNLIARGVVTGSDDSKKFQRLQLELLEGETKDDLERFQSYGFTSNPEDDAEALALFSGGRRDHGIVIAVDDRRYRLKGLARGEVAVYDKTGSKILLKANGDIELTPHLKVKVVGDLDVSGTVTAATDVVGGGKSLKNHTHSIGSPSLIISAAAGSPVTGGPTGAPS